MRLINAKVCLNEMQTDGTEKEVKRSFFVDAETFTEAETMIAEQLGTTDIKSMSFVVFDEYVDANDEGFCKATINMLMLDEITAKEKKQKYIMLIVSNDVDIATQKAKDMMQGNEYELVKVEKLNIEGIIKK